MSTTYNVPDISCDHCVRAITEAVSPLDGVESVAVSVEDKAVTVTGEPDDAAVRAAIEEAGYAIS